MPLGKQAAKAASTCSVVTLASPSDLRLPISAVWFAFWGEAKSRPTYRQICAERDREYERALADACREIADDGYDVDVAVIVESISALTTGLWLDLLLSPRSMSREEARCIVMAYLSAVFPRHFPKHS